MAYPTTTELVAASTVDELLSLTPAQQDALRLEAIGAVERYTGQRFEARTGTLTVDGTGGRELYPPERVEALTAIAVSGTSIDLTDVVVSPDGDRLHFAPLSTGYAVEAMRESPYDRRRFTAGAGTVTLTGTFGWSTPPAGVTTAIRLEMEDVARVNASALSGIVASARRLGMRDVSQGNLRVALDAHGGVLSAAAAAHLEPYVWHGPAGYLV